MIFRGVPLSGGLLSAIGTGGVAMFRGSYNGRGHTIDRLFKYGKGLFRMMKGTWRGECRSPYLISKEPA